MSGPRHRRLALGLALAFGSVTMAHGEGLGGLKLGASYTFVHDSNLFRLPDGVDPSAALGRSGKSETIDVYSLELGYSKEFSLQEVSLQGRLVDYRYRAFDALDQLAVNYDGRWRWAITPRLSGTLRALRDEAVNAFDDASVLTTGTRRVRRHESFDLRLEVDGLWRAVAGVRRSLDKSDQPLVGSDSYLSRAADVGLRYEAPSGSAATLRLRAASGRTLDGNEPLPLLRDDRFRQIEAAADVRWVATTKTTIDAEVVQSKRMHPRVPDRDYAGTSGRIEVNWSPTAKTQTVLRWTSELSSYQTERASYSRSERIDLALNWDATSRIRVGLGASESRRRFLGAPTGLEPDPREDTTTDAQLNLRWAVGRQLAVESALQEARRRVNLPGFDYSSRRISIGLAASL